VRGVIEGDWIDLICNFEFYSLKLVEERGRPGQASRQSRLSSILQANKTD